MGRDDIRSLAAPGAQPPWVQPKSTSRGFRPVRPVFAAPFVKLGADMISFILEYKAEQAEQENFINWLSERKEHGSWNDR